MHTNLTTVQAKLLEILNRQFSNSKAREIQQRKSQQRWTEFTVSLEERLELISVNASTLLQELLTGLLRVQDLTRDSTALIGGELHTLEKDIRNVRSEIRRVHEDVGTVGSTGAAKLEELAGAGENKLSMVE